MRNVQKIIDSRGGLTALKQRPIRLRVPGFMRLVIEHVGTGPRGGELVSVARYGEQNGDLMRDPEIVFEVAAGKWQPVSIQQDYVWSAGGHYCGRGWSGAAWDRPQGSLSPPGRVRPHWLLSQSCLALPRSRPQERSRPIRRQRCSVTNLLL